MTIIDSILFQSTRVVATGVVPFKITDSCCLTKFESSPVIITVSAPVPPDVSFALELTTSHASSPVGQEKSPVKSHIVSSVVVIVSLTPKRNFKLCPGTLPFATSNLKSKGIVEACPNVFITIALVPSGILENWLLSVNVVLV